MNYYTCADFRVLAFHCLKIIMSNPNTRKSCIVPKCTNTTFRTPEKLFFFVPMDTKIRKLWLQAMRRLDPISDRSCVYCCEDHFDIENDMENYIKFKLAGGRIKLKQGLVPHKFECQQKKKRKAKRSAVRKQNPSILEPLKNIYLQDGKATEENVKVKEEPVVKEDNLEHCNEYDSPHRHGHNLEIKDEPLRITICQKEETLETKNESHIYREDDKYTRRGSKCNVCDQFFKNKKHLESHIINCAISYSCKICDKQFNNLSILRTHILTHIGGTAHTCEVCSKTFANRYHLKSHERTHTGEKRYTCDICHKSYSRASDLRRHKKAHVG